MFIVKEKRYSSANLNRLICAYKNSLFYATNNFGARSAGGVMATLVVYGYAGFILLICMVYAIIRFFQKFSNLLYQCHEVILDRFSKTVYSYVSICVEHAFIGPINCVKGFVSTGGTALKAFFK